MNSKSTKGSIMPATVYYSELLPDQFVRAGKADAKRVKAVKVQSDFLKGEHADRIHLRPVARQRKLKFLPDMDLGKSSPPPPPPQPSVAPFNPSFSFGHDPQVAVGHNYVVAVEAHYVAFYDKSGNALAPKNNIPTSMSSYDLFQRFLKATNADGSTNLENVNRHAGFVPTNPALPCDVNTNQGPSCINEVFDLRVTYDTKRKRFIFAGIARNQMWVKDGPDCLVENDCYQKNDPRAVLARRYTMFAITVSEDPRDGFHTYWVPSGGDWDQIAVTERYFLITYNGVGNKTKDPLIYIFSADDMAEGSSTLASWVYFASDLGVDGGVTPVTLHDATGGRVYFVAPNGTSMMVWAWIPPVRRNVGPSLIKATAPLGTASGMIKGKAVLQSGKIHLTFGSNAACPPIPPGLPECPSKVRVIKIALKWLGFTLVATKDFDYCFGHQGPGDDPSDFVSYELPSLEVNKKGNVVIAYIRRPVKTKNPLFNEVRYSVLRHNESSTRPSVVLKKGEGQATKKPLDAGIDLAVLALDPSDRLTIWITHAYALDSGSYGMIVGTVKT